MVDLTRLLLFFCLLPTLELLNFYTISSALLILIKVFANNWLEQILLFLKGLKDLQWLRGVYGIKKAKLYDII